MRLWVFVCLCIWTTYAKLPPGYEEVMLCPPRYCLDPKPPHHSGFSGPKTSFFTCCQLDSGKTSSAHSWGVLKNVDELVKLLDARWHTERCPEGKTCATKTREAEKVKTNMFHALMYTMGTVGTGLFKSSL